MWVQCWRGLYPNWTVSNGFLCRGLSACGLRFTDLDGGISRRGLELSWSVFWVRLGLAVEVSMGAGSRLSCCVGTGMVEDDGSMEAVEMGGGRWRRTKPGKWFDDGESMRFSLLQVKTIL
ncbi:hypothetical protein V6N12_050249 [Hibiscus sabdariffa]|uniref:Uncharacterized protein n=1 Tax=Hibiscus sabdariffa TaxID=183260 RepID=A0ABR2GCA5_9ROSI